MKMKLSLCQQRVLFIREVKQILIKFLETTATTEMAEAGIAQSV
jgi:hypothetical protein